MFDVHASIVFRVGNIEAICDDYYTILDSSQQRADYSVVFLLSTDEVVQDAEDNHGLDFNMLEGLEGVFDVQGQRFAAHLDLGKSEEK